MWGIIHMMAWIAILLLTIGAFISFPNNKKRFTILVMIDRFFYIIVIVSGIMMIQYSWQDHLLLVLFKVLLGIIVIGVIEMLLSYRKKSKPTTVFLTIFSLTVILTIAIGFYLSGGYPLIQK